MTIRYLPTQATSQVMMPSHVVTLQIHYLHPFSIGQYARSFLSWCAIRTLMQQNQLEKPASFNNFCMEWLLCSVACPRVLGSLSCCFMLFHAVHIPYGSAFLRPRDSVFPSKMSCFCGRKSGLFHCDLTSANAKYHLGFFGWSGYRGMNQPLKLMTGSQSPLE